MKRRSRIITVILFLTCMLLGSMHVSAADDRLGTIVDGSLLTDNLEAETTVYPLARGTYLSSGTGGLTIKGARSVRISGSTNAYQNVDEITVTLHLQRLEGNKWVNVTTLGPKTAYNTYTVSNANTYSVTGGYYYRVYGGHSVIEGGRNEAVPSYTDGVWVN